MRILTLFLCLLLSQNAKAKGEACVPFIAAVPLAFQILATLSSIFLAKETERAIYQVEALPSQDLNQTQKLRSELKFAYPAMILSEIHLGLFGLTVFAAKNPKIPPHLVSYRLVPLGMLIGIIQPQLQILHITRVEHICDQNTGCWQVAPCEEKFCKPQGTWNAYVIGWGLGAAISLFSFLPFGIAKIQ